MYPRDQQGVTRASYHNEDKSTQSQAILPVEKGVIGGEIYLRSSQPAPKSLLLPIITPPRNQKIHLLLSDTSWTIYQRQTKVGYPPSRG